MTIEKKLTNRDSENRYADAIYPKSTKAPL